MPAKILPGKMYIGRNIVRKLARELSGGQKQRIAIVRALCMNPEIMLFDEVTAALDPEMVREVLDVILGLAKQGMTMVIVTHEMGFAQAVADRIVFIDAGNICEIAKPAEFFANPQTERAQQFLNIFQF
ncbi:MAG: glnQ 1 [Firmicutes bacterium]|nr:glnQ 1 [Bacillota bacterium]